MSLKERKPPRDYTQRRINRRKPMTEPRPSVRHDLESVARDIPSFPLSTTYPSERKIESASKQVAKAFKSQPSDMPKQDILDPLKSESPQRSTNGDSDSTIVPAANPLVFLPEGSEHATKSQPRFEPVKSVPQFRKVPPWRIDKSLRFSQHRPLQGTHAAGTTLLMLGPWTGLSPPTASHTVRAFTTKAPKLPTSTKKTERKPGLWQPAKPLPILKPTNAYLTLASRQTFRLHHPQCLLLVLDLNGTLLHRKVGSSNYTPRPFLPEFLNYCLSNHKVLIWSSATPKNVSAICARLFTTEQRTALLGEWARDTFGLNADQYAQKTQVYKGLDRIWANEKVQHTHHRSNMGGRWDQHNTLLLDDSVLKAIAQPHNLVQMPEFTKSGDSKAGNDVLGQVTSYLEEARMWDNVSSFVKTSRFKAEKDWGWDWSEMRNSRKSPTRNSDEEDGGVMLEEGMVF